MYAVTSMPPVRRTRATLRRAEFGFLGVVVYTRVHTPPRCGLPLSAGVLVLVTLSWRPLRTSWLIVGTDSPYVVNVVCPGRALRDDPNILVDVLVRALSRQAASSDKVLPPALSDAPKEGRRGLPGGRFDPDRHRLGPCWNAMRIWSGSGARARPGTVIWATAWAHSIQIGMSSRRLASAGRTLRPAPAGAAVVRGELSRGRGRGSRRPGGSPRPYPDRTPDSRTGRSSAWCTSRPLPLRWARP